MREWKLNNKYFRRLSLFVIMAVASLAVGYTLGAILHNMSLENAIHTPTVDTDIVENVENGAKVVQFTNEGEADAFIRVAFAESWNYGEVDEKEVLSNLCKDQEGDMVPVAQPDWLWAEGKEVEELWTDGGDGWWYYNKVLPAEGSDRTTEPVLEEVNFDNVSKLSEADQAKYEEASYDLHFTIEAVQASDDWEVSLDALKELFGDHVKVETKTGNGWTDKEGKLSADLVWTITTAAGGEE